MKREGRGRNRPAASSLRFVLVESLGVVAVVVLLWLALVVVEEEVMLRKEEEEEEEEVMWRKEEEEGCHPASESPYTLLDL